MANKKRIPHKFQPWIDARKKFRLSNAHIQMARELGLSPKRFGSYADITNQPWKVPLPEFIEQQYFKQFGKERPDVVRSIEEIAASHVAKRAERKLTKQQSATDAESATDSDSACDAESAIDCNATGDAESATDGESISDSNAVDSHSTSVSISDDSGQPTDIDPHDPSAVS